MSARKVVGRGEPVRPFRIKVTRTVSIGIAELYCTGLYGRSHEEVVTRLLDRAIENRMLDDPDFGARVRRLVDHDLT